MNSYVIEFADGSISEHFCQDDEQAVQQALEILRDLGHDDAVAADQWDANGVNDDGEPMKRILIWENKNDAKNDNGAKSIAQVVAFGRP